MSRDKRKKHARAMALIRSIKYRWWAKDHEGPARRIFSGPMTETMRYCVERGFATVRRSRAGQHHRAPRARHNVFDAE